MQQQSAQPELGTYMLPLQLAVEDVQSITPTPGFQAPDASCRRRPQRLAGPAAELVANVSPLSLPMEGGETSEMDWAACDESTLLFCT